VGYYPASPTVAVIIKKCMVTNGETNPDSSSDSPLVTRVETSLAFNVVAPLAVDN